MVLLIYSTIKAENVNFYDCTFHKNLPERHNVILCRYLKDFVKSNLTRFHTKFKSTKNSDSNREWRLFSITFASVYHSGQLLQFPICSMSKGIVLFAFIHKQNGMVCLLWYFMWKVNCEIYLQNIHKLCPASKVPNAINFNLYIWFYLAFNFYIKRIFAKYEAMKNLQASFFVLKLETNKVIEDKWWNAILTNDCYQNKGCFWNAANIANLRFHSLSSS